MAYIFDTNTLLEAKNRYYSFDVCPAFWDWLVLERQRGNVLSIQAVKGELEDPDAAAWAKANPVFFDDNDDSRVADVGNWVYAQARFIQAARQTFRAKADPRKEVEIPDVCDALGATWTNCFHVLTELKARFILETQP